MTQALTAPVKETHLMSGLTESTGDALAAMLDDAAMRAETVPMLTVTHGALAVEDGYAIQRTSIARRVRRGDTIVGHKLGLTSRAKMEQVGVHEPIRGVLTRTMWLPDEATISLSEFCHARVEPEIAFVLAAPVRAGMTPQEALACVSRIHVALEVIDSRYRDFVFTLPDVVADNCSSARFVIGDGIRPQALPSGARLDNLGVVMSVDGKVVETASSAAVLGNPLRALCELAAMLEREGTQLAADQVILSGGATAAITLASSNVVTAEIEHLGVARLTVA